MERLDSKIGPETLRKFANNLEDKRQMANVERCIYLPELNQNLLLALNGATSERSGYRKGFPNAGAIIEELKERLIEAFAPSDNRQSVVLGFFYTNIDPFERKPTVKVGVFPLYVNEIQYTIRPKIDIINYRYYSDPRPDPRIELREESFIGEDPFLVYNPKGQPGFLFFKQSPFKENHPYQTVLPKKKNNAHLPNPKPFELALEENVIKRTLWILSVDRKPKLFSQAGFAKFINSHCSEPQYVKLHAAFTQLRRRK